jgi:hypothetical protein
MSRELPLEGSSGRIGDWCGGAPPTTDAARLQQRASVADAHAHGLYGAARLARGGAIAARARQLTRAALARWAITFCSRSSTWIPPAAGASSRPAAASKCVTATAAHHRGAASPIAPRPVRATGGADHSNCDPPDQPQGAAWNEFHLVSSAHGPASSTARPRQRGPPEPAQTPQHQFFTRSKAHSRMLPRGQLGRHVRAVAERVEISSLPLPRRLARCFLTEAAGSSRRTAGCDSSLSKRSDSAHRPTPVFSDGSLVFAVRSPYCAGSAPAMQQSLGAVWLLGSRPHASAGGSGARSSW